jgi:tRNA pseudouridine55 synthase
MDARKAYCAEVVLGTRTNTDDAEGVIVGSGDWARVTRAAIDAALPAFTGETMQVPPAYAAVKLGGQRLYALARKGVEVQVQPRRVTIHTLRVLAWEPPRLRLFVECGSGTYIRSLARDLGDALGVFGYLHALRRVGSGAFRVEEAATLGDLETRGVDAFLRAPDLAVAGLAAVAVSGAEASRVAHGAPVPIQLHAATPIRIYDDAGRLLALGECRGTTLNPFLVFPQRV